MPEFRNREELENWLKDKPVEWSRVIASRAALRVLPLIAETPKAKVLLSEKLEEMAGKEAAGEAGGTGGFPPGG